MISKTRKKYAYVRSRNIGESRKRGRKHRSAVHHEQTPSIRLLPTLCLPPLEMGLIEFYKLKYEPCSNRESTKVVKERTCCGNFSAQILEFSLHAVFSPFLERIFPLSEIVHAERRTADNLKYMNRSPSSVFSTVSIASICRSQLGRFPHFLIALGSRSATTGLALSEDDAGEGDTFRETPLLFLPLFLDRVSSSSSPTSSSLPDLTFSRSLPRFFVA
jgi:hypothetical protein